MGRVTGFDNLQQVAQAAVNGVNDTLSAMMETAQAITPVDTGFLVSSYAIVQAAILGMIVRGSLTNDAFYFIFVDKGTVKMAPRNMSAQIIDFNAPSLPANIRKYL